MTERYDDIARQIRQAGQDVGGALAAAALEIAKPDAEVGLHRSDPFPLDLPVCIGFGVYREKLKYTAGCMPEKELSRGVGVVSFRLRRAAGDTVAAIMRTPQEWDRRNGGTKKIAAAGEPGDFILTLQKVEEGAETKFRYLDPADIAGVVVAQGQELTFPENDGRQRQLVVPGEVANVVGFR